MIHIDEDTIIKYHLELLDENENKNVRNHISNCKMCSSVLFTLEKQMNLIGSYDPNIENEYLPKSKGYISNTVWPKRAAILILGFLLGYFTSEILKPEQINIIGQNLIPQTDKIVSSNFIDCPNVDIFINNSL